MIGPCVTPVPAAAKSARNRSAAIRIRWLTSVASDCDCARRWPAAATWINGTVAISTTASASKTSASENPRLPETTRVHNTSLPLSRAYAPQQGVAAGWARPCTARAIVSNGCDQHLQNKRALRVCRKRPDCPSANEYRIRGRTRVATNPAARIVEIVDISQGVCRKRSIRRRRQSRAALRMMRLAHIGLEIGARDRRRVGERLLVRPGERSKLVHLGRGKYHCGGTFAGRSNGARGDADQLGDADRGRHTKADSNDRLDERKTGIRLNAAATHRSSAMQRAIRIATHEITPDFQENLDAV